MTEHTPGPWHLCNEGRCTCLTICAPDFPVTKVFRGAWGDDFPSIRLVGGSLERKAEAYIEQITYGEIPHEVALANALLIASAPDLLAALRDLLDDKTTTYAVRAQRARAAIAKATTPALKTAESS